MEKNMQTEKERLRKAALMRRDAMPNVETRALSERIAGRLLAQPWYVDAQDILVYASIRSEVDLTFFCMQAWEDKKRLFFPRVCGADMDFYRVDSFAQLVPGAFSVPEPPPMPPHTVWRERMPEGHLLSEKKERRLACSKKTVILVPGVVFSRSGARIGYGKGYYDRYLEAHPTLAPIGICYEDQIVQEIYAEIYDRPMEKIVTEAVVYDCSRPYMSTCDTELSREQYKNRNQLKEYC